MIKANTSRKKLFRLDKNILTSFNQEIDSIFTFSDTHQRVEKDLKTFELKLAAATKSNEFINTNLALKLFSISKILVALVKENPTEEYVPYVLAAISYLMKANDANDDFETLDGFEDDKLVIQSVLSEFNLQDYVEGELKKLTIKGASA